MSNINCLHIAALLSGTEPREPVWLPRAREIWPLICLLRYLTNTTEHSLWTEYHEAGMHSNYQLKHADHRKTIWQQWDSREQLHKSGRIKCCIICICICILILKAEPEYISRASISEPNELTDLSILFTSILFLKFFWWCWFFFLFLCLNLQWWGFHSFPSKLVSP